MPDKILDHKWVRLLSFKAKTRGLTKYLMAKLICKHISRINRQLYEQSRVTIEEVRGKWKNEFFWPFGYL